MRTISVLLTIIASAFVITTNATEQPFDIGEAVQLLAQLLSRSALLDEGGDGDMAA